jgi:hypothetical protein
MLLDLNRVCSQFSYSAHLRLGQVSYKERLMSQQSWQFSSCHQLHLDVQVSCRPHQQQQQLEIVD